jgi:hypothetical protein
VVKFVFSEGNEQLKIVLKIKVKASLIREIFTYYRSLENISLLACLLSGSLLGLLLYPEDGGSVFLQNVGKIVRD